MKHLFLKKKSVWKRLSLKWRILTIRWSIHLCKGKLFDWNKYDLQELMYFCHILTTQKYIYDILPKENRRLGNKTYTRILKELSRVETVYSMLILKNKHLQTSNIRKGFAMVYIDFCKDWPCQSHGYTIEAVRFSPFFFILVPKTWIECANGSPFC